MKKLLSVLCAFMILSALIQPCAALAGVDVPPENTVRFDVSYDEYQALGERLFAEVAEESDSLNHMNTFPALPESLLRLVDEFRNNSSTLEKIDNGVIWNTEALKIVYDERMLGVQAWVEFGSEEKKLEIYESEIVGRMGTAALYLPDGYAFEDISALRIRYSTGSWLEGWFGCNALFDLTYHVSDGKVICSSAQAIMECGYCMDWGLGRFGDDNRLILCGGFENLSTDASWCVNFDAETGELEDS